MSQGTAFQVGSFDLTKYGPAETWARMNQMARFYAALNLDFRLLAFSRPYPLTTPLERIKEMMAAAQRPRWRQQFAAYRRFLELCSATGPRPDRQSSVPILRTT